MPAWLKGTDKGWITAEYSMRRAAQIIVSIGSCKGETVGADVGNTKAHRTNFKVFIGFIFYREKTVIIDCDVIQADGGTRCASITGGWLALFDALYKENNVLNEKNLNLIKRVAAISVGYIGERLVLDLITMKTLVAVLI